MCKWAPWDAWIHGNQSILERSDMNIYFLMCWLVNDTAFFLQGKRKLWNSKAFLLCLEFNILPSSFSLQGLLEEDNQWMTQINRLQKLIDRLEKKVGASFSFFFLSLFNRFWPIISHCFNTHGCLIDRIQSGCCEWLLDSYFGFLLNIEAHINFHFSYP